MAHIPPGPRSPLLFTVPPPVRSPIAVEPVDEMREKGVAHGQEHPGGGICVNHRLAFNCRLVIEVVVECGPSREASASCPAEE